MKTRYVTNQYKKCKIENKYKKCLINSNTLLKRVIKWVSISTTNVIIQHNEKNSILQ